MEKLKEKLKIKEAKACITCNGCPENRMDVARAQKYLRENGWIIENDWKNADLILFNACGRSRKTETQSLSIIKEIQSKKRENQHLIVWGCLPKIDSEKLSSQFQGLVSPGSELSEIQQLFGFEKEITDFFENKLGPLWSLSKTTAPEYLRFEGSMLTQALKKPVLRWDGYIDSRFNLVRDKDPTIFYIKISTGCRSKCAYCAIQKSRRLDKKQEH